MADSSLSNYGVPTKTNESSDDVLDSVKSLSKEVKVILRNQLLTALIELALDI